MISEPHVIWPILPGCAFLMDRDAGATNVQWIRRPTLPSMRMRQWGSWDRIVHPRDWRRRVERRKMWQRTLPKDPIAGCMKLVFSLKVQQWDKTRKNTKLPCKMGGWICLVPASTSGVAGYSKNSQRLVAPFLYPPCCMRELAEEELPPTSRWERNNSAHILALMRRWAPLRPTPSVPN